MACTHFSALMYRESSTGMFQLEAGSVRTPHPASDELYRAHSRRGVASELALFAVTRCKDGGFQRCETRIDPFFLLTRCARNTSAFASAGQTGLSKYRAPRASHGPARRDAPRTCGCAMTGKLGRQRLRYRFRALRYHRRRPSPTSRDARNGTAHRIAPTPFSITETQACSGTHAAGMQFSRQRKTCAGATRARAVRCHGLPVIGCVSALTPSPR